MQPSFMGSKVFQIMYKLLRRTEHRALLPQKKLRLDLRLGVEAAVDEDQPTAQVAACAAAQGGADHSPRPSSAQRDDMDAAFRHRRKQRRKAEPKQQNQAERGHRADEHVQEHSHHLIPLYEPEAILYHGMLPYSIYFTTNFARMQRGNQIPIYTRLKITVRPKTTSATIVQGEVK